MFHKQRLNVLTAIILFGLLLTGCSGEKGNDPADDRPADGTVADLFQVSQEVINEVEKTESTQVTSVGRGFKNLQRDENNTSYVVYGGGELSFDYSLTVQGDSSAGIGLLIWVDGIPQAYCIGEESTLSYMHLVYPPEGEYEVYHLHFIPSIGEKGDNLELTVGFILAPGYMPETGAIFGSNHLFSSSVAVIRYEETPEKQTITPSLDIAAGLDEIQISGRQLTLEERNNYLVSWGFVDEQGKPLPDELETNIGYTFLIDGQEVVTEHYFPDGRESIRLSVETMGVPGMKSRCVVYCDHYPIGWSEEVGERKEGELTVFETNLDVSKLEKDSTIYVILVPVNDRELGKRQLAYKSFSVVLHGEEEVLDQ